MKIKMNFKSAIVISTMAMVSVTALAQHRHSNHIRPYGYHSKFIRTIVQRPVATVRIDNYMNKKDRLDMALAYLKTHEFLSVSTYRKMTGLSQVAAEAELDVFANSMRNPIKKIQDGRKKFYVLT